MAAGGIKIKTPQEVEIMRRSGRLLAETMEHIRKMIAPGVKSKELDKAAEEFIRAGGGRPAFKGHNGFPATLCTSFNEQVVHGIPGDRELKEGDLLGIDCGVVLEGWFSDMAESFIIGEGAEITKKLSAVTKRSLELGIEKAVPGNRVGDISSAVQKEVERNGFSVVRSLCGHGIGKNLWEEPQVPNFGRAGKGETLKEGMVIAIEPMVNIGTFNVKTLSDGWTIITVDKRNSCHFEHTVAITATGNEILTRL